jgi:hypothetical protein
LSGLQFIEERRAFRASDVVEVVIGRLPLLLLISATLRTILAGLATPTEAAGIGAAGALVLSIAYGRLTWDGLQRAMLAPRCRMFVSWRHAFLGLPGDAVGVMSTSYFWNRAAICSAIFSPIVRLGVNSNRRSATTETDIR